MKKFEDIKVGDTIYALCLGHLSSRLVQEIIPMSNVTTFVTESGRYIPVIHQSLHKQMLNRMHGVRLFADKQLAEQCQADELARLRRQDRIIECNLKEI